MLKIYNSLTKQKEAFEPLDQNHIKYYSCGPTVYNRIHIGNARAFICADLLAKVLKGIYPRVTYVSNITDIDDKIIEAAKEEKVSIKEITNKYYKIYLKDLKTLGIDKPDIQPFATDYIDGMIKYIEQLIVNNNAYVKEGNVLFDVTKFPNYGCLSGRNLDEQKAGKRVDIEAYKRNHNDFILWKPSDDDEPGWESPWGYGRPGWHLECSVMSELTLNIPFDIHGGGNDLKFPHHDNEIAQTCAYHNTNNPEDFAKYWFHNGFLNLENEKMSKSMGNVVYLDDLLNEYDGNHIRLALLSSHYRQPIPWTRNLLEQAKTISNKISKFMADYDVSSEYIKDSNVAKALTDDLNTPKAISTIQKLIQEPNESIIDELRTFKYVFQGSSHKVSINEESIDIIKQLVSDRDKARNEGNYDLADKLRDKLLKMNVSIKDVDGKTEWEI
ncbi:MAG: cysteine--tRNA ligase [Gammaproteobacteria bacterium]